MSRYWDSSSEMEERIWRGVVVSRYREDVSVCEYIRAAKHGDTNA